MPEIIATDFAGIPAGLYCYSIASDRKPVAGGIAIDPCPFWRMRTDKPAQENGFCTKLGIGDWQEDQFSLLWDQVKECGINLGVCCDDDESEG